ncbi:MAG: hypothetical protein K0U39_07995 [Alphaproteobacteria bacterium]|nr:hypothetical protein [Alphaproteobacteria bacterium]
MPVKFGHFVIFFLASAFAIMLTFPSPDYIESFQDTELHHETASFDAPFHAMIFIGGR